MRASVRRPAARAGRVPFALVCCALIAATMVALLALNIAAAQASYSQDALQARLTRLGEEQQALRERLEAVQAPASLEQRATAAGLVPSGNTAFLSLEDAAVLGKPAPAPEPTPEPPGGAPDPSSDQAGSPRQQSPSSAGGGPAPTDERPAAQGDQQ